MIESRTSEIDLDKLKARIRLAVARREAEGQTSFAKASAELFELLSREDFSPEQWLAETATDQALSHTVNDLRLQPEFVPQESYHVNDLLKYHDYQFIWNAYRALLKRTPDEEGLRRHLAKLRSGQANKIDILWRLRNSVEGKAAGVEIEGLGLSGLLRRAFLLPVVGYLFEWAYTLVRLPSIVHGQRQDQTYLVAQQEGITNHQNIANRSMAEQLRKHGELVQTLTNAIAQVAKEQKELARLQHQQLAAVLKRQPVNGQLAETTANGRNHLSEDQRREMDDLYASFQARFRSSQPATREDLKAYLPLLEEAGIDAEILDLGCGGGEWLEILHEAGLRARGVESNRALIAEARKRNAIVIEADAARYLRTLTDNSLRAVTAFHFVEHLDLYELIELLREVRRTLKPGGIVILETPNPKNLVVGACNFYSDPTHHRPLFPESLEFMVSYLGFERARIQYLHPVEGSPFDNDDEGARALHSWFFSPRDYAVIAFKPLNQKA